MKSKFTKQPEQEIEDDDVDVESTGPSIAQGKKSKIAVIAASSVLITVVLYFLFFKESKKKDEQLVEVAQPKPEAISRSETGESPFEIKVKEEGVEEKKDLDIEKPLVPEVPVLPSLPESSVNKDSLALPEEIPLPIQDKNLNQIDPNLNQKPAQQQPVAVQNPVNPTQVIVNEKPKDVDPRYAPIIVFGAGNQGDKNSGGKSDPTSRGVGYENNIINLNNDPISSLNESKPGVTATFIKDRRHTIAQGKLLTAVLETAINTEIPGSVRAIVSRDVYGEAGNDVLIPKGSRLFGSYSSKVVQGQGRVEISWTRLIRPDGIDLAINFNASDQFGRSGISGDVDNKYGSIVTTSILTSILAIGGVSAAQKLLTNNQVNTTTTNPTQGTTTTTGSPANQAIYDVSKTIIDTVGQVIGNTINVTPVIRVPQGTRVTVIVNSDITIPSQKSY